MHPGRPRNSTGRRAFIGDVDSPQQFKLLPWTTLRVFRRRNVANNGCFSRLPAGAAAGRRRATEILLGGGTRARLLNTVAQRDQGYLECRFGSGLKPKRLRVRVRGSRLRGGGSLFFSRKSLHDLRVESPGAGRGPARLRTGFPQNPPVNKTIAIALFTRVPRGIQQSRTHAARLSLT